MSRCRSAKNDYSAEALSDITRTGRSNSLANNYVLLQRTRHDHWMAIQGLKEMPETRT